MYSVFPAFSFGDYRVQVTYDFSAKAKRLANQRIVESVEQSAAARRWINLWTS